LDAIIMLGLAISANGYGSASRCCSRQCRPGSVLIAIASASSTLAASRRSRWGNGKLIRALTAGQRVLVTGMGLWLSLREPAFLGRRRAPAASVFVR